MHIHILKMWKQYPYNHHTFEVKSNFQKKDGICVFWMVHMYLSYCSMHKIYNVGMCGKFRYGCRIYVNALIILSLQWRHNGRFKSPASLLFTQPFIKAQIKEKTKALRHWPLWGEFTGHLWIPRENGPVTRIMFPYDAVIKMSRWGHLQIYMCNWITSNCEWSKCLSIFLGLWFVWCRNPSHGWWAKIHYTKFKQIVKTGIFFTRHIINLGNPFPKYRHHLWG